ncbi:hypothetical protein QVG61_12570 [Thiohalobacter sp. IOR34]|uniref:hypothetical protein n=1 Tax=Thiohalobacter sp. IOR34 TaxID=3057176 RepID=UPI0025B02EA8|nr:hypothetical protein [Thiohalobacter sp. IOR34]WJW75308.1 hypothetical protein QVG61_12570 [Thiohalobacter sp. IOR34]
MLVCAMVVAARAAVADPVSLGIRAPVAPFMWKDGKFLDEVKLDPIARDRWIFLEENIAHLGAAGGEWNIVDVRQWVDNNRQFHRLHRVVEVHEKHGVGVVFRILESPQIYDRLSESNSPEYGYDAGYFAWVRALAQAFKGRVSIFLIGNEAELDLAKSRSGLASSDRPMVLEYSQYGKVLATAIKAIKSVDPTAKVANSGFSDKSIALAVAHDIWKSKGLSAAHDYWEAWKGRGGIKVEGKIGLFRLLNDSDVQRRIAFVRDAIHLPMGSDLFQLHYYGGWRALEQTLKWIDAEMRAAGAERPIIAAEVGYGLRTKRKRDSHGKMRRMLDLRYYSDLQHASNTVKVFAILFGHGINRALYWNIRDSEGTGRVARLFPSTADPTLFKPTVASRAFRVLSDTLSGARPAAGRIPAQAGIWEYRFAGKKDVSVIWSDGRDLTALLSGAKEVWDLEGRPLAVRRGLPGVKGPVYAFW